jgi:hypothetical protein
VIASLFPTKGDQTFDLKVMVLSIVIWSLIIIVILLLMRFSCGERFRNLNLLAGTWWKDILVGTGLSAITLTLLLLSSEALTRLFP